MNQHVTMATLAEQLGVSESTVSRALRGDPRISAKTRARVTALADSLSYQPNAMVSALMSVRRRNRGGGQIDTVALVTDYQGDGGWRSKDVCRWEYQGVCERAEMLGYRVEEFAMADYGHDGARLEKALLTRGIRGVLLGFSRDQGAELQLNVDKFTVAGLSTYFHELQVDRANFHGLYNVRLALREMQAAGFRRTGVIVPEFNNRISGFGWSSGALDWQRQRDEKDRCAPLVVGDDQPDIRFFEWLDTERPDSLLVYKVPVRSWLSRRGLCVPEDIAVAYLYRTQQEMSEAPGIDGSLQRVGAAAIDLVVEGLHTNHTGVPGDPKEVLIKGKWQGDAEGSPGDLPSASRHGSLRASARVSACSPRS